MSDTELLLKEIEGLPPSYMGKILDFVGQLKHNSPPMAHVSNAAKHEEFAKNLAGIRELCKDSTVTVDNFLEERHAERDLEDTK